MSDLEHWLNAESQPRPRSLLGRVRKPAIAAAVVVGLFFGAAGTWAAFAPLSGAVVAPGQVDPEGRRRVVQHLEGGLVTDVHVRDGDTVAAGDALFTLRSPSAEAEHARLTDARLGHMARIARLEAELTGAEVMVLPADWPADDADAVDFWAAELDLFDSRRQAHLAEMAMLTARESQLAEELAGKTRLLASKRDHLVLVEDEIDDIAKLVERRVVPRQRLITLQKEQATLVGEIDTLEAERHRADSQKAEVRHQRASTEETRQEEIRRELADLRAELVRVTHGLTETRGILSRLVIRAPVDGTVINAQVNTVGAVVPPGEPIAEIVPREDALVVVAHVAPQDIDEVIQGANARVQLTAFSQRHTHRIEGTVARVGADRQTDPNNGEAWYTVEVVIPDRELAKVPEADSLKPGMPADVAIVTRERTVLDYLVDPLRVVLRRGMTEA